MHARVGHPGVGHQGGLAVSALRGQEGELSAATRRVPVLANDVVSGRGGNIYTRAHAIGRGARVMLAA